MDIYLSGRFTVNKQIEKAWLKRTKCTCRCFSFAFVNPAKPVKGYFNKNCVGALHAAEEAKVKIMMDSGAFSLHGLTLKAKKQGATAQQKSFDLNAIKELMYESYKQYCLENKKKWEFYVTLDFVKNQEIIMAMQERFLKDKLKPMPVYHGDSNLDWLSRHKDMGHSYICIGGLHLHKGSKFHYLDKVFNYGAKHNITYHGLAMTNMATIIDYPFRSVDSSTWSRTAAFGMILIPDVRRKKFLNLH